MILTLATEALKRMRSTSIAIECEIAAASQTSTDRPRERNLHPFSTSSL